MKRPWSDFEVKKDAVKVRAFFLVVSVFVRLSSAVTVKMAKYVWKSWPVRCDDRRAEARKGVYEK